MTQHHTPGPWIVHPYVTTIGPHALNKALDVGPAGRAVCTVIGEFEKAVPGGEAEANAKLIAAAPDLLAALKEVRAYMAGENGRRPMTWGNFQTVAAAIAKAEA
jgi:hypothetical protein